MDKQREYILSNWQAYNLTDTKDEFVALLNCLEAYGETIDSLHDVVINGYDEFIGVWHGGGTWESDREVVETVFAFSCFFTLEEFKGYLYEQLEEAKYWDEREEECFKGMNIEMFYRDHFTDDNPDCQIIKTTDGYVKRVRY